MTAVRSRECWACGALVLALAAAARASGTPAAAIPAAELQHHFLRAGQAYDAGRLDEAVALYEELVQRGYCPVELFFNLGNAYFRLGRMGLAALNYRRAWVLAPRDPDVAANLRFTLDTAGALSPSPPMAMRLLQRASLSEWAGVLVAAYWIGAASLALWLLAVPNRALWIRIFLFALGVMAMAGTGTGVWLSYWRHPEVVIVQSGQRALFAPLENATPHFEVPEGSILRLAQRTPGWLEVDAGGRKGWVREDVCQPVQPETWQKGSTGL